MVTAVVLGLVAAATFGTAVALQSHQASAIGSAASMRPTLLTTLASRPLWLIGLVGDVVGFGVQTAALTVGSIVVVQPLLTVGLVVALGVRARLDRRPLQRREWAAVAGVVVGLVVFYVSARPTSSSTAVTTARDWWTTGAIVAVTIALALAVARRARPVGQATLFALAAGCAEAMMAVFSKAFGDDLGRGVSVLFTQWEPYVLVLVGIATLLVVQSAYQLERSTVTLPVITVSEPVISMLIGAALFGERFRLGAGRGIGTVLGLLLVVRSLVFLARQPATHAAAALAPPPPAATSPATREGSVTG